MEVRRTENGYTVTPLVRGKADLPALLRTNAMFIAPKGGKSYVAGDEIEVELLRNIAEIPFEN